MDPQRLRALLDDVRRGAIDVDQAMQRVRTLPFEDLGFARLDGHRALRKGFSEVVYCAGKTPAQVAAICERLALNHDRVLGTRATLEMFEAVQKVLPDARYHEVARLITAGSEPTPRTERRIIVATGGTSDIPVAEEALITARWMGCPAEPLYDVGVAGLHRLLHHLPLLEQASAIIAVAGMEGALASVLAGLVAAPVIGVPTSVGYGAQMQGLAPLLTMLSSCATGVAVVNIDNGFGAGMMAALIALGHPDAAGSHAVQGIEDTLPQPMDLLPPGGGSDLPLRASQPSGAHGTGSEPTL